MRYPHFVLVTVSALSIALALVGCESSPDSFSTGKDQWRQYGEQRHASGDRVLIGALQGDEKDVVFNGIITEVCKVKGCWMYVRSDAGENVFVRFKDYGFFVPRNAAGHRAIVHGWAEKGIMSVDELRHYAEDAGKSSAEIAAITEPQERITFFADSVLIQGDGLQKPHTQ